MMNAFTVGEQLKQARMARQLHFKDVTKETKIQPWVLEALEANQLHTTMSSVYVKSFLATYAKCLRLNPEPLIAQLYPTPVSASTTNTIETNTSARPTHAVPTMLKVVELIRRAGPAIILAGVLVLLVKANPIRFVSTRLPRHEANVSIVQTLSPPAEALVSLPPSQLLELVIIAHRATWVSVKADGKLVAQQQLATGTQETWKARRRFTLIVGAPAKADILLNGQSINPVAMAYHGRLAITHHSIKPLDE